MENPYLGLYEIMIEVAKGKPSFFIAKIKTPLPNLEIQLNDVTLYKDDLLIDKWLLDRNEDLFTVQDKLQVDDEVILLKVNDKFIVLNKVVSI